MQVVRQELVKAAEYDARREPADSAATHGRLRDRFIEVGFIGGVFLALALVVVASVGL